MGVEIERKFLVDHEQWAALAKPGGTHYRQGYALSDKRRTIRVRIAGEHGYITFKGATQGISRMEYEYEVPVADAKELLDIFTAISVEKIRYRIDFAGKVWEVDEFLGDNAGLIVAEIELQHSDEHFVQPPWVGKEVSNDERYYNSNLSVHPFNKW